MKKLLAIIIICLSAAVTLTSCNNKNSSFNVERTFDQAIIKMADEWKTVDVISWAECGNLVQIETKDGVVYMMHFRNVVLIHRKTEE